MGPSLSHEAPSAADNEEAFVTPNYRYNQRNGYDEQLPKLVCMIVEFPFL